MCQQALGATDLDGLAFQRQGVAFEGAGYHGLAGCVGAHFGAPERDLASQLGRQLRQNGRRGDHVGLGEDFFQGFHAEVVVGVGLAHVDSGELLATVEHVGSDAQGVGTGEAGVNDDGVFLAIDQRGIDVEAVGVGVVDLDGERLLGVGCPESDGE